MALRFMIYSPFIRAGHHGYTFQRTLGCGVYTNARRLKHDTTDTIVSKNLRLITSKEKKYNNIDAKPLVVMLPWLLARKRHVHKYYDIYLSRGYDVLSATITPWQFFWPITGSQMLAVELIEYLHGSSRQTMLVHGFSIGAYLWGECLVKINSDLNKYSNLISKIKGQIWDSAVDITETSKGLSQAMFPRNAILRSTMQKYVDYHLSTFYDTATQHYLRASQLFHTTPVRAPCLILVSKNDPIGSVIANTKAKESWDSMEMKVYWKCFEKSRHVSHLMIHRDEYLTTLLSFLDSLENIDEQNITKQMSVGI